MNWIGNAVGAAIGLVALLLGAMTNAALNRRRDKHMREQESRAIRAAVAADLIGTSNSIESAMGFLDGYASGARDGYSAEVIVTLATLPESIVIPKLGDKIGLLPAQLAADVVMVWHLLEKARVMHAATIAEIRAGAMDRARVHTRYGHARDTAVRAQDVAKGLSGAEGWFTTKPVAMSADSLRAMLSGKPGDLADARERGE